MCKSMSVANFFIDMAKASTLQNPDGEPMTNMRLNKMMYFAQGWHLARYGEPLFADDFQAWEHGPVIRKIYDRFRVCGKNSIDDTAGRYSFSAFTDRQKQLLMDVMAHYDGYTTSRLRNMTHEAGTPWRDAYVKDANNTISKESIEAYFRKLNPLPTFEMPALEPVAVKRNPVTGNVVLPKEWHDEEEQAG